MVVDEYAVGKLQFPVGITMPYIRKCFRVKFIQAAAAANPELAGGSIFFQKENRVIAQRGGIERKKLKNPETITIVAVQSAMRADPHKSFAVFMNGIYISLR